MASAEQLQKYAELVVKVGVNLQEGQDLVINSPIECAPFARACARAAYECGGRDVAILWADEEFSKLRMEQADLEVLTDIPAYQVESRTYWSRRGAAFISISASNPELLKDVDPHKISETTKATNLAMKEYREAAMSNEVSWCVVSVPTAAWAQKVFPEKGAQEAVEALWQAILSAVRADQTDPVNAWEEHKKALARRMEALNALQIDSLHYKNSRGTDLTVGLAEGCLWCGGPDVTKDGVEFVANMPTEEVFTTPHCRRIDGVLKSALPLNYNGSLIEDFSLTFEAGRVVDFSAKEGEEVLRRLLETDEGACSLGEVALIPYDSPLSNMGILFYNTLFDENASCHFAFGASYPFCMKEGGSKDELERHGANQSLVHVDFMIGTSDLEITATLKDGSQKPIFNQGNWAF